MPDERIIQQVSGILSMNDVTFETSDDEQTFLVQIGSASVLISFFDVGDSTIVSLRAIVLEQVDGSADRRLKILEALNEKNRSLYIGTFYLTPEGLVVIDHHLLGDELQAVELIRVLDVLGATADGADDELRELIGSGVRASDAWNLAQGGTTDSGGVGPVVET